MVQNIVVGSNPITLTNGFVSISCVFYLLNNSWM